MKQIKSKLLIFFVFIICLIPITKSWAVSKKTPINVKWECDKDSCNKEKQIANIRIKPIGNAPIGDDLFEIKKGGSLFFEPDFNKAGKYEYLIYQENKDIKDDKSEITYDRTVYRLVYVVQQGSSGLSGLSPSFVLHLLIKIMSEIFTVSFGAFSYLSLSKA